MSLNLKTTNKSYYMNKITVKKLNFIMCINASVVCCAVMEYLIAFISGNPVKWDMFILSTVIYLLVAYPAIFLIKSGIKIENTILSTYGFIIGPAKNKRIDLALPFETIEKRHFYHITQRGKRKLMISKYLYGKDNVDAFITQLSNSTHSPS